MAKPKDSVPAGYIRVEDACTRLRGTHGGTKGAWARRLRKAVPEKKVVRLGERTAVFVPESYLEQVVQTAVKPHKPAHANLRVMDAVQAATLAHPDVLGQSLTPKALAKLLESMLLDAKRLNIGLQLSGFPELWRERGLTVEVVPTRSCFTYVLSAVAPPPPPAPPTPEPKPAAKPATPGSTKASKLAQPELPLHTGRPQPDPEPVSRSCTLCGAPIPEDALATWCRHPTRGHVWAYACQCCTNAIGPLNFQGDLEDVLAAKSRQPQPPLFSFFQALPLVERFVVAVEKLATAATSIEGAMWYAAKKRWPPEARSS